MIFFSIFMYLVLYFVLHSVLCSLWLKGLVKQKYFFLYKYYRLLFNVISTLLLIPVLVVLVLSEGSLLWTWDGWQQWCVNGIAFLAIVGFYLSLKDYDMQDFSGIKQAQSEQVEIDEESFAIGNFHRYIRHPWYFFLLVLLWSREMDKLLLMIAIMSTLYLVIGSALEENKLIKRYGDAYIKYKIAVPGLFPLPWRYLTKAQAKQLLNNN